MKEWILILVIALSDGSIKTEHVDSFDNLPRCDMPRKQGRLSSQLIIVNNLFAYRNLYNPNISDPVAVAPTIIAIQKPYIGST